MQALTTEQLRALFPNHRGNELAAPDPIGVDWGVLDYLGWVHPAGHTGFAVVPCAGELHGLVLRRSHLRPRRPHSQMCAWCNFVHRSRGAAMFSATVEGSDGRRTIGSMLCSNLDCSVRIRNLTGDMPGFMPETLHLDGKIRRLENALATFLMRINKVSVY
ncbi:MAG: FBP domain-containing protein [Pseudomonadota bacterium]